MDDFSPDSHFISYIGKNADKRPDAFIMNLFKMPLGYRKGPLYLAPDVETGLKVLYIDNPERNEFYPIARETFEIPEYLYKNSIPSIPEPTIKEPTPEDLEFDFQLRMLEYRAQNKASSMLFGPIALFGMILFIIIALIMRYQ